jgi:threonine/homoserine/homoserine lactone efflux protein
MGVVLWRTGPRSPKLAAASLPATSLWRIFVQGALTNILNPKVALFFLAFLPQFVDPEGTHRLAAFLLLGTVFNTTGLAWNLFVAWSSAGIGRRVGGLPARMHALHRIAGAVFVALGIKLALTAREAS